LQAITARTRSGRGGDAQRGGAADRVAQQDDTLEIERRARRPAGRRGGRSRSRIRRGATLVGPVERDHPVVIAMTGAEASVVAGPVADGVRADDGWSPALVVVCDADAVEGDRVRAGLGADSGRGSKGHPIADFVSEADSWLHEILLAL
jgi:hypothetical protein